MSLVITIALFLANCSKHKKTEEYYLTVRLEDCGGCEVSLQSLISALEVNQQRYTIVPFSDFRDIELKWFADKFGCKNYFYNPNDALLDSLLAVKNTRQMSLYKKQDNAFTFVGNVRGVDLNML